MLVVDRISGYSAIRLHSLLSEQVVPSYLRTKLVDANAKHREHGGKQTTSAAEAYAAYEVASAECEDGGDDAATGAAAAFLPGHHLAHMHVMSAEMRAWHERMAGC